MPSIFFTRLKRRRREFRDGGRILAGGGGWASLPQADITVAHRIGRKRVEYAVQHATILYSLPAPLGCASTTVSTTDCGFEIASLDDDGVEQIAPKVKIDIAVGE